MNSKPLYIGTRLRGARALRKANLSDQKPPEPTLQSFDSPDLMQHLVDYYSLWDDTDTSHRLAPRPPGAQGWRRTQGRTVS